jgi:hypothetical protein
VIDRADQPTELRELSRLLLVVLDLLAKWTAAE